MTDLIKQRMEELLQRALDDDLSIEEACGFLSMLDDKAEQKIHDAAHAVVHFVTDQDIRQADREYDRLQRQLLSANLESLKNTKIAK